MKPIFIFSLPRSGSTLLQRVLGSHSQIHTVSEPWLLLPLIYALRAGGVQAEYSHRASFKALSDYCQELPHKEEDYYSAIRGFAMDLYRKTAGAEVSYFLDKTPRYHLVAEEIIRCFPQGKFIFLWRNPLAIAASIMETWKEGRWNLHRYHIDLYKGMKNILDVYARHSDRSYSLKYEEFIGNPEGKIAALMDYLDLPADQSSLTRFSELKLIGELGDKTGVENYTAISTDPLHKWKKTLSNPLRKHWAKRYLRWLGREHLQVIGCDYEKLLKEVESISFSLKYTASDFVRMPLGVLHVRGKQLVLR